MTYEYKLTPQQYWAVNQKKFTIVACPACKAEPGSYCVTVSGKNPGRTTDAHQERQDLALFGATKAQIRELGLSRFCTAEELREALERSK